MFGFETAWNLGANRALGWLDHRFIHQQNRDVIAHGIDAVAACTFQARPAVLLHEILTASRADDDVENILGNHEQYFTPEFPQLTPCFKQFTFALISDTGSRVVSHFENDWEAGANPALPRNCKRGHRSAPLENHREGTGQTWALGVTGALRPSTDEPYSRARRPARTTNTNPFRETKEE